MATTTTRGRFWDFADSCCSPLTISHWRVCFLYFSLFLASLRHPKAALQVSGGLSHATTEGTSNQRTDGQIWWLRASPPVTSSVGFYLSTTTITTTPQVWPHLHPCKVCIRKASTHIIITSRHNYSFYEHTHRCYWSGTYNIAYIIIIANTDGESFICVNCDNTVLVSFPDLHKLHPLNSCRPLVWIPITKLLSLSDENSNH